jgi:hypothetical protein
MLVVCQFQDSSHDSAPMQARSSLFQPQTSNAAESHAISPLSRHALGSRLLCHVACTVAAPAQQYGPNTSTPISNPAITSPMPCMVPAGKGGHPD